jgi:hypothetical protein
MYRHELRFVLRFGVHGQFNELAQRLYGQEQARGWTPPRIWQAVGGHVNQIVIEHEYETAERFREERAAFHADSGQVGEILGTLGELAVPATAVQTELDGFDL